jgi:hypothetical protein
VQYLEKSSKGIHFPIMRFSKKAHAPLIEATHKLHIPSPMSLSFLIPFLKKSSLALSTIL